LFIGSIRVTRGVGNVKVVANSVSRGGKFLVETEALLAEISMMGEDRHTL
jgi:hypothetical protein